MELEDYQGMEVKEIEVCKGPRYQNLWWVKEAERMVECSIHFLIYWEALQAVAVIVPILTEEVATNYQRIACFAIGPHAIPIQARQDPSK